MPHNRLSSGLSESLYVSEITGRVVPKNRLKTSLSHTFLLAIDTDMEMIVGRKLPKLTMTSLAHNNHHASAGTPGGLETPLTLHANVVKTLFVPKPEDNEQSRKDTLQLLPRFRKFP